MLFISYTWTYVLIVIVGLPISLIGQFFLARFGTKWFALGHLALVFILSTLFLLTNLDDAFHNIASFGEFIVEYGWSGVIALILKSGFIFVPFALHVVLFFAVRKKWHNHKNELRKMMIEDL